MKTINIYIRKDKKEQIDKMKLRYQLSLTTIVDILVFETYKLLNDPKDNTLINKFKGNYIYLKTAKTSIKEPKVYSMLNMTHREKCIFATNVLECYMRKDFKQYIKDQTKLNKYYCKCDRKMTDTYEENWNYNNFIRMQRRMLRANKDYFRKALEQV